MAKKHEVKSRFGSTAKIRLAVLLIALFLWGLLGLMSCSQTRPVSSEEVVIFHTGGGSLVGIIVGTVLGSILVLGPSIFLVYEGVHLGFFREFWDWLRKKRKLDIGFFATLSGLWMLFAGSGAAMIWWNAYHTAYLQQIVVDKSEEVISIENKYLLKGSEGLQISFYEIYHIAYHYHEARYMGSQGSIPARGSVEVTKHDGTAFEISRNGPGAQLDLAKAVAQATGKPLVEK